jgi:isopenicillin N synthase-like dioxygenase
MLIPTITPAAINDTELDAIMRIGFCYAKLPDETLVKKIQTCIQVARDFFQGSSDKKNKWRLKETLQAGDKYEGYIIRSQSKNTNILQQIFFEPDAPFGPYLEYAALIQEINNCFINLIALPIIKAIFTKLQFSPDNFMEATAKPKCSLVFQSCTSKDDIQLNAHKDFGLITVLYFEEPGLEVKFQDEWSAIAPQKGSVIVNLGNATELMTGKRCHSAIHRVKNATDGRISMVYFVNPNYVQQVRNYADDSIIAATGEVFFKQQFTDYYEVDH